jgi:hypothetical protein
MFTTLLWIYLAVGLPTFFVLWACVKVGGDSDG